MLAILLPRLILTMLAILLPRSILAMRILRAILALLLLLPL